MKTSHVLNGAADLIERDGWYSMRHGGNNGGNCASNAICAVRGELVTAHAHEVLIAHIGGMDLGDIFAWNDAADRTASEVVEALRACAVIEAAKENPDSALALLDVPVAGVTSVRVAAGEASS